VFFPGFVKDIAQVYAALDAFAFPSSSKSGTALQAAMAAGLPSIRRRAGALGEVVDGERTALAVEPNGKEFAVAMLRLISDGALRKNLSEAGRREVEQRFSAGCMVENTIRVYEDVLPENEEGLSRSSPALRAVSFCNTDRSISTTVSAPASHDGKKKGEALGRSFELRQALQAFL